MSDSSEKLRDISIEKYTEMQAALDAAKNQLEAILNTAPNAVIIIDNDNIITGSNQGVFEYFGLHPKNIIGLPHHEFNDRIKNLFEQPAVFTEYLKTRKKMRTEHIPVDIAEIIKTSLILEKPKRRSIAILTVPVMGKSGERLGQLWSYEDLGSLIKSTEFMRNIVNLSPVPTIVSRLGDGEVIYVNEPLAALVGLTTEELVGSKTPDFYADPADREIVKKKMTEKGQLRNHEVRIKRQDGTVIWMIFNLTITELGGEKVILGALYDINERKMSEQALSESEERFRQLTDNINEVFWMTSLNKSEMIYVSPQYEKVWGRKVEELYEQPDSWFKAIHPEDRDEVATSLPSQVKGDYDKEFRVVRPDGEIRWVRDIAFPVKDKSGKVYRVCGVAEDITERKESEDKLRLYERVYRHSSDTIIIMDTENKIQEVNQAFVDMWGYTPEEVIGNAGELLMDSETIKKMNIMDLDAETDSVRTEMTGRKKDGSEFIIETASFPIYDEEGSFKSRVGILRDISRRKQAEESIRVRLRYEEGLASCSKTLLEKGEANEIITRALSFLVEAANVESVYIYQNVDDPKLGLCMKHKFEACAELCSNVNYLAMHDGKTRQYLRYSEGFESLRDSLENNHHFGGLVEELPRSEKDIFKGHGILSILTLPIWVDGAWYGFIGFDDTEVERSWTDEEVRLLRTAADVIGGYIARRHALDALSMSEERFRSLVENANDVIYSMNSTGEFTYLSPNFEEFTGYPNSEFIGKTINAILHEDDIPVQQEWLKSGIMKQDGKDYEFRILNKDFGLRWITTKGSVIRDSDGNVIEIVGIAHDITDMKKMLDDPENVNLNLRETQGQLVQSEKMASLGMLVAGIAHEINTPIGAINSMQNTTIRAVGKLKTLIDGICQDKHLSNPKLKKMFDLIDDGNNVIESGIGRVTKIISRLRSFARLDEADLKLADVHEGIDDTLTLIHHEMKHNIKVIKEFGKIPSISCFPSRLNQVFLNLLINAKQAIKGKGSVTISTFLQDDHVHITFQDTGIGIEKERLSKVFDPGYTTKGVGVGTGLGLSICYQIIKDHRGEIEVTSEVGNGTTFTIIIPTNLENLENNNLPVVAH